MDSSTLPLAGCPQFAAPAEITDRSVLESTLDPRGPGLPVRARAASIDVVRLYPGAVGELLAREMASWGEFGHRFGGDRLLARLVEHVERGAGALRPPRPSRSG